jgi:hypothetical protein
MITCGPFFGDDYLGMGMYIMLEEKAYDELRYNFQAWEVLGGSVCGVYWGSGATPSPKYDFLYNPSSFSNKFSPLWDQRQWLQVRQLTP